MNEEQAKSFARWVQATIGPFLIAHGYTTDTTLSLVLGVFVSLAPLVWSMIAHTQANAVVVATTIATGPASATAVAAQTAIIAGTAAIAQDKAIPKSNEAVQTLIAATVALPEVQTIIADKSTADASPSPSVVSTQNLNADQVRPK